MIIPKESAKSGFFEGVLYALYVHASFAKSAKHF